MNNQNGNGEMMIIAVVLALLWIVFQVLVFLVFLLVLIVTALCFAAWNRPLRWDDVTLEPATARHIIGAGVFSAFCGFGGVMILAAFNNWHFTEDELCGLIAISYSVGILGAASDNHKAPMKQEPIGFEIIPPSQINHPGRFLKPHILPPPPPPPVSKPRPGDFADWED